MGRPFAKSRKPLSLLLRAGMLLTVGEPGGLEVRFRSDPLKFGSLLPWQIRPLGAVGRK